jgi:hypothetical protein
VTVFEHGGQVHFRGIGKDGVAFSISVNWQTADEVQQIMNNAKTFGWIANLPMGGATNGNEKPALISGDDCPRNCGLKNLKANVKGGRHKWYCSAKLDDDTFCGAKFDANKKLLYKGKQW